MRAAYGGVSSADTGRMIGEAVKTNSEWVFPGASNHRSLVEREVADLLAALPPAPTDSGTARHDR